MMDAMGAEFLTVIAGPAKAKLSSMRNGMASWVGSMYGMLRLRS
jgi:hypothetical protein